MLDSKRREFIVAARRRGGVAARGAGEAAEAACDRVPQRKTVERCVEGRVSLFRHRVISMTG
jgi:hypothetical protein